MHLKKIPIRISVSGTRGKSSIVRTLASIFRNHGMIVLAKTTGTQAMYIMPDGQERPVKRFGKASILEQKRLVHKASELKVDCLITEIMSIHPECHQIETQRLIKPNLTIFSNFRPDHTHVQGRTQDEISKCYVNDIFPSSTVLMLDNCANKHFLLKINRRNSSLIRVKKDVSKKLKLSGAVSDQHFSENLDLAIETARHFNVDDNIIKNGIENTQLDIGRLEIFRFTTENKSIYFVNSFAANDPVSSMGVIQKVSQRMEIKNPKVVGLLALRSDRGERSQQWLDWIKKNKENSFRKLYVIGAHQKILCRKIEEAEIIKSRRSEEITRHLLSICDDGSIIFGMGNFHGTGKELLEFWKKEGDQLSDI